VTTTAFAELYVTSGLIGVFFVTLFLYLVLFLELRIFSCNNALNAIPFTLFIAFANMWSGNSLLGVVIFVVRVIPLFVLLSALIKLKTKRTALLNV
jgi:hypothetical protein